MSETQSEKHYPSKEALLVSSAGDDSRLSSCPVEDSLHPPLEEIEIEIQEAQADLPLPTNVVSKVFKYLSIYYELSKPRLSLLVVITTIGTYAAASDLGFKVFHRDALKMMAVIGTGTFLQAACANTINQVMESDRDSIMGRTKRRPLPTNRISHLHAFAEAVVAGAAGTSMLWYAVNPLTSMLGAINIFVYTCMYTTTKPRHWINTWVGTINGSLPPLMGSAAATGLLMDPVGLFSFSVLYLWQIPHFMAIGLKCGADYKKAGYEMLPHISPPAAANQAALHALLLLPLTVAGCMTSAVPVWFGLASIPIHYKFLIKQSLEFRREPGLKTANSLFWASLAHLPLVFFSLVAVKVVEKSVCGEGGVDAILKSALCGAVSFVSNKIKALTSK
eukprot:TRINITY_DN6215_c0_g1_i1.p1 TRINITY_DN6215_c0_g1~~TRINITY_DN6215_c0_g1_i1.p1  ORF type:complete len:417 (+),score=136.10 TRINITY_DN6215_c0_g1_i1:80-1252(+)